MKLSPSEVKEEIERVRSNKYSQFIKRVYLRNVRGFSNQSIELKYPVTALIGTNGGGKSTILGACGVAYKTVRPGQFFPKSFIGDESMSDWLIEFELIDKPTNKERAISRSAKFVKARWRRDEPPTRHVEYIEIQRTVPAGELSRFRRFLHGESDAVTIKDLGAETAKYASAILSKDVSGYKVAEIKDSDASMYVGRSGSSDYSQFHFGAGEASVIATIDRIESSPDNSLILIEEVENGLHPVAVRELVAYLENVARRKRHQIIFTTHSQDAVNALPSEGVWASINKTVIGGHLEIESLRAISGSVPDQRYIFVEDQFAKAWVSDALVQHGSDIAATTKVFPAGGYPNVINVVQYHNSNPATTVPSVALVDGDIYKPDGEKLPPFARFLGEGYPEAIVFEYVHANRVELTGVIQQRCLLTGYTQEKIVLAMEAASLSACDPHLYFEEIGKRLDFSSGIKIRDGMINIFNEKNPQFWQEKLDFVRSGPTKET